MLKAIAKKIASLFTKPETNAAQAWQVEGDGASHSFWMYSTPVNMQLGRDSYFLTDPASVTISDEESVALVASLNAHFEGFGYAFYFVNGIWFLGLDRAPNITTTTIDSVKNQDIANHLPKGEGALEWNKLQNEIQMLLFSHPVNQAREQNGVPIINSLWCYGLGKSL